MSATMGPTLSPEGGALPLERVGRALVEALGHPEVRDLGLGHVTLVLQQHVLRLMTHTTHNQVNTTRVRGRARILMSGRVL
jgi:hypothetical protein